MQYQHVKPQRDIDHTPFPVVTKRTVEGKVIRIFSLPLTCNKCGNKIKEVPDNEGPESLKSFFTF